MWRKRNPNALLVGMQTGAATIENSVEVSQKIQMDFILLTNLKFYSKKNNTIFK